MWKPTQPLKRIAQAWDNKKTAYDTRNVKRKWSAFVKGIPQGPDGKVLLHIGCGDIDAQGFINIDAKPGPHVHIVTTNLLRLIMIPENTADLIYMSHVLEHVSHREIVATLREMHRILKSSGILRISVPDFDKIIHIYITNNKDVNAIEGPLMGGQNHPFNYHYSVFNGARLEKKMLESGFREARSWNPANCDNHNFDDWASRNISWNGREFPISLNIEAIK
jgi:predicted SAM-dependent methyltransferase